MAAAMAVGLSLLALVSTSARADGSVTVEIAQLTPDSQPSGSAFRYRLSYGCSGVDDDTCPAPSIRVPLADATGFVTGVAGPDVDAYAVDGTDLVITLHDLAAGDSGSLVLTMTPPNGTTPNGTTWTLEPTITSGASVATTPTSVASTATAKNPLVRVNKLVQPATVRPGDEVTYTIQFICDPNLLARGRADLGEITVVDELPAGLSYLTSSNGGTYDPAARTVTWNFSGDRRGFGCATGASGVQTVTITAVPEADMADGTVLVNRAEATGTPFDGANVSPVTVDDDARITIVTQVWPIGNISKQPVGPLRWNGEPAGASYGSATYQGRWGTGWTPDGFDSNARFQGLRGAIANGSIEMGYWMRTNFDIPGAEVDLTDPVPCLDDTTGSGGVVYVASTSGLCQRPAFNPTHLSVQSASVPAAGQDGVPADYRPMVVLTDGSQMALDATTCYADGAFQNGNRTCVYTVPGSAAGRVAEVRFPRDARMTDNRLDVQVGGYAAAGLDAGSVLRNRAHATVWFQGEQVRETDTPNADVALIGQVQLGLIKSTVSPTPYDHRFRFSASYATPVAPEHDVIVADLLPAGITTTPEPVSVRIVRAGIDVGALTLTPEIVADPAGSGRQLVRLMVPRGRLSAALGGGAGLLELSMDGLPSSSESGGSFTNIAGVYTTPGPAGISDRCLYGTPVATDPQDLDGVTASQRHCAASLDYRGEVDPASTAFRVTKEVRGDGDDEFRAFPQVGRIDTEGGSAEYRLTWRNRGGQPLDRPVLYDLLPHPGDTGIVASTRDIPRGSTFTPTLTAIGALPAGVAVEYSTATNPCRPEVLPDSDNPGCVDDWSTAAPVDLAAVRGLRFRSAGTYLTNETFAVTFSMATPAVGETAIAWNTAAANANHDGNLLTPVEAPRVGIANGTFGRLQVGKTANRDTAERGDRLTYTVVVQNVGSASVPDVVVTDTLPDHLTAVEASNGGVVSGSMITWDVGTLAPGVSRTFTVRATVADDAPAGTLVNRATVDDGDCCEPPVVLHPCEDDPTASCAETEVPELPSFTVDKKVDETEARIGDELTYTIEAINTSGVDGSLQLLDALPPGVEFVSASDGGTLFADPFGDGRDFIQWPEPFTIAAGGTRSVTLKVRLGSEVGAAVRNCGVGAGATKGATVDHRHPGEVPPLWEGSCVTTDVVTDKPDITIEKSVAVPPVAGRDGTWTVDYDLVVTNRGAAGSYRLTDRVRFGAGVTLNAIEAENVAPGDVATNPAFDGAGHDVVAEEVEIDADAVHRYQVSAVVSVARDVTADAADCALGPDETGTGTLNEATVSSPDSGESGDDACAALPSISVVKEVDGAPRRTGDTVAVRYRLTVTNRGATAGRYDLADRLAFGAGITVTRATATDPDGTTVRGWDGADEVALADGRPLDGGATETWLIEVVATVPRSAPASALDCTLTDGEDGTGLRNVAELTHNGLDAAGVACGEVPPRDPGRTEPPGRPSHPPRPAGPDGPRGPVRGALSRTGTQVAGLLVIGTCLIVAGGCLLGRRREAERP